MLTLLLCLMGCKKKKDDPWTMVGEWQVESVTLASNPIPDHSAIGHQYHFKEGGTCTIRNAEGEEIREVAWHKNKENTQLTLGTDTYVLYECKEGSLIFGQMMGGEDLGTYHLVPR